MVHHFCLWCLWCPLPAPVALNAIGGHYTSAAGPRPSALSRTPGAQAGPDKAGDYHVHTGGGSCRYACCYLCHCRGADRTSAPSSTLPIPHITPSLTVICKQQALCCASVVLLVCCCCAAVVLLLLGCAPACGCAGTVVHRPAVVARAFSLCTCLRVLPSMFA